MGRPVARDRRAFPGDEDPLNELPIAVLILVGTELVRVNEGWTALTGLEWRTSIGGGWLEGIQEDDRQAALDLVDPSGTDVLRIGELRVRPVGCTANPVWVHARSRIVDGEQPTCVLTLTEIDARKAHEMSLLHRATHDAATGLPNRDGLHVALDAAAGEPLAVMFIDLDRFKDINDMHGHAFGDLVLATVARRLEGLLRPDDTVARLGGDEFAVLCAGISRPGDAVSLADRVISGLGAPLAIADRTVHVGASVGIAMSGPQHSTAQLVDRADRAMYRAKSAGGSQWSLLAAGDPDDAAESGSPKDAHREPGHAAIASHEDELEQVHHVQVALAATENEVLSIVAGAHADERSTQVVRQLFEQLWSVVAEAADPRSA
jgi:diguanylate cyclase (GGDEF)-like protein